MNVLELIAFAQRVITDQGLQVWGGPAVILEHLNVHYEKVHGRMVNFDIGIGEVYTDFAWADPPANKRETTFLLPQHFEAMKFVEFQDSNGKPQEVTAWPSDRVEAQFPGFLDFNGFVYWMKRNRLVIDTFWAQGQQKPATVRCYYYRSPQPLSVIKPSAASSTTITLPTEPYDQMGKIVAADGAYDGSVWEIVEGPGAGQVFEIDTFVGSTRVGTLESGQTLSPLPTTDSIIAGVPALPQRAHPLIAYETACDGARIEENNNAFSLIENELDKRWDDLDTNQALRQFQMSRRFQTSETD
ncbi:MAG: hypothetical protein MJA83_07610 [Gammaproteobacteria bacterium]|nr:hypothetical protein [Gammaproteobacteria bacterium]